MLLCKGAHVKCICFFMRLPVRVDIGFALRVRNSVDIANRTDATLVGI